MNNLIDINPIFYELPNHALPKYGGGSFLTSDNLLFMTTRRKSNQSMISLYDFSNYFRAPSLPLPLISHNILAPVSDQLQESLGQSYPYLYPTHDGFVLLYSDWFKSKETGSISNRLSVAILNRSLIPLNVLFSTHAPTSASGAPRILDYQSFIRLAIPLFCASTTSFPNYSINLSTKIHNPSSLGALGLAQKLLSLTHSDFSLFHTYLDKSTYLNHLTEGSLSGLYVYAGRNNNNAYNLYSAYSGMKHCLINLSTPLTLSYPSHFLLNRTDHLLVSAGRYGSQGLYCGRLV
jgi:hypothetical protein